MSNFLKQGEVFYTMDKNTDELHKYVVISYADRHSYMDFTTHYIAICIDEVIQEEDITLSKIRLEDAYRTKKEAVDAFIAEKETEREEAIKKLDKELEEIKNKAY